MKTVFMILYMVAIGAAIGAFTNHLAIKMLFRPYKPVYIGKWRVPFTPGLIPRRREELAVQMGIMVVNHLLSAERIRAKILNKEFQAEITLMVQKELDRLLSGENTVRGGRRRCVAVAGNVRCTRRGHRRCGHRRRWRSQRSRSPPNCGDHRPTGGPVAVR